MRRDAVVALGAFRDDYQALDLLVGMLEARDWSLRACAARQLGRGKEGRYGMPVASRAVLPLIAQLADERPEVRAHTADSLGESADARAVEPLIAATLDGDSTVRAAAAAALGKLGDTRAVDPLLDLLRDDAAQVRASAAEGLGELGDPRALPALREMQAHDQGSGKWQSNQVTADRAIQYLLARQ